MALLIWWREGEGRESDGVGVGGGKDAIQVDMKPQRLADLKLNQQFQNNFTPDQINSG